MTRIGHPWLTTGLLFQSLDWTGDGDAGGKEVSEVTVSSLLMFPSWVEAYSHNAVPTSSPTPLIDELEGVRGHA